MNLYNGSTAANFGWLGDNSQFHGICEDRDGNMWFGASGPAIKKYDIHSQSWYRYYIDGVLCCADSIAELTASQPDVYWGKHDAIAQDSSGFMWFGCWTNAANIHSLICWDIYKRTTPDFLSILS